MNGCIHERASQALSLFRRFNIDTQSWNGKDAKSIESFFASLAHEQVWLEATDTGLVQHICVAVVTVRHITSSSIFELLEAGHEFPDGTMKKRSHIFDGSIAGKIHRNESNIASARRELEEELGQSQPLFREHSRYHLEEWRGPEIMGPMKSDFHPGLFDTYHRFHYLCFIGPDLFMPEYTEHKSSGRTIIFGWKQLCV